MVFCFCGQGSWSSAMGVDFFQYFTTFRSTILELDDVFKKCSGFSLVYDHGFCLNIPEAERSLTGLRGKPPTRESDILIVAPSILFF